LPQKGGVSARAIGGESAAEGVFFRDPDECPKKEVSQRAPMVVKAQQRGCTFGRRAKLKT